MTKDLTLFWLLKITATRGVGDRRQAVEEGVLIGIPWPIGQRLYVHLAEIN